MASCEVVGCILFATDELLRVEQLPVRTGSHFVDHRWFQVKEDGTRHVLTRTCLAEEGVEGIITSSHCFITGHLSIGLQIH